MKHRDILELRKRLKKDQCTISRMSACYVNSEKNIVATYDETFLNMEEEEFFKFMEIAKKALSGTLGNNLLELEFRKDETRGDGRQNFLMRVKSSRLKDEELVRELNQQIIDTYRIDGNYLILLFSDAYDIISRTTDELKLDESEETYEYMICAVCPVTLSKPGLHYEAEEKKMKAQPRDWLVGPPAHGFLYPALTDRSTDVNTVLYYSKNPKETHPALMEEVLGCQPRLTTAIQRESVRSMLTEATGFDEETADVLYLEFHESLSSMVEEHEEAGEEEPIPVTVATVQDILSQGDAPEEVLQKIEEVYAGYFGDDAPLADRLVDPKALKSAEQMKKELALEKQVENLLTKLEEIQGSRETTEEADSDPDYDVRLSVAENKKVQIETELRDGRRYILIPLEEDERAAVNGDSLF